MNYLLWELAACWLNLSNYGNGYELLYALDDGECIGCGLELEYGFQSGGTYGEGYNYTQGGNYSNWFSSLFGDGLTTWQI